MLKSLEPPERHMAEVLLARRAPGPGEVWGWDMEDTRNTETPWVVPPPRMPVANEGL